MGLLDKARKLAEQAKEASEAVKKLAAEVGNVGGATTGATSPPGQSPWRPDAKPGPTSAGPPAELGTPYVPGMLGRPGWREMGLTDPAGVLPIQTREQAGLPHSTKSQIVEEPFGMGRRWSGGGRSAALFYQLYPEHRVWDPPGGRIPDADLPGATAASLPDGRTLVFVPGPAQSVVLEVRGIDDPSRAELARTVAERLSAV